MSVQHQTPALTTAFSFKDWIATTDRFMWKDKRGNWHVLYHRMFDPAGPLDPNCEQLMAMLSSPQVHGAFAIFMFALGN